ncbi:transcription initiation factor tfiid subunit [Anaeramoeba flamelloides]|uniref:Transcription initiation factor tfiid subunit n=1 Tax=Anaeramoeba flamelloides TaxID=1746091 RepID=A0AAV7Y792_9EUKA|nr:transcription initiation factor tfiid subunit [Anaeramoeba flamelloides]
MYQKKSSSQYKEDQWTELKNEVTKRRNKLDNEREEMIERRKQMEERSNKLENEREEMIQGRKQMEQIRKQMIQGRKQMEQIRDKKKEELKQMQRKLFIFDLDSKSLQKLFKNEQDKEKKNSIVQMIFLVGDIEQQNEQIKEQNEKIKEQNEQIKEQNEQIKEQNQQIKEQNQQIKEQNLRIKEQNLQIDKQDERIEKQNLRIKEQNKQIDKQNEQIDKQDLRIEKQNEQTKEQNQLIEKLNQRLDIADHGKKNNLDLFHFKPTQEGSLKLKTMVEQYLDFTQQQKNKQTLEDEDLINKFNETNLRMINSKFNEDSIPFVNREDEMKEIINGIISDFLEVEDQTLGKKITNLTCFGSSGIGKTRLAKSIFFQPKFKKKFKQTLMEYQNEQNIKNLKECYDNFLKYHLFFYINYQEHALKNWETTKIENSLIYRLFCALTKFNNDPYFTDDEELFKLSNSFQSVDPIFNNFQQVLFSKKKRTKQDPKKKEQSKIQKQKQKQKQKQIKNHNQKLKIMKKENSKEKKNKIQNNSRKRKKPKNPTSIGSQKSFKIKEHKKKKEERI